MTARYQYLNYDQSHRTAEIIYRMLMTRLRCRLASYAGEGPRRSAV